ncbi:putative bifunctional diguanylate cyclase/phosphodiesterase [Roseibium sp.]|uniref:putative bifunctional diguanylate cyclase/phosphodiesterase n=1 Tax=Roseibium sp. TaxID=1936156 RepID=UPI003D11CFAD
MSKQVSGDAEGLREGVPRLRDMRARLDRIHARWCANGTQVEKPLRAVFLTVLALTVCTLTLLNIVSEYRTLREPQEILVQTAEKLLMQQRALGTQTLDQAINTISANTDLQNAIRDGNKLEIELIADRVFAGKANRLEIVDFTIYGSNQELVYRARTSGAQVAAPSTFHSDLASSLFSKTNSIEFGPELQAIVSVFRPWVSGGTLLGYLKLSIDIEPSLVLAGAAVNAQIVKICQIEEKDAQSGTVVRYKPLGDTAPSGFDFAAITGGSGFNGLNRFSIQDGRVFMIHDLPLPLAQDAGDMKLVLVKDVTSNAWDFLGRTLISLLAGIGLASLSWMIIRRLLSGMQSSVWTMRQRLETELLESTRKLEHSAYRLNEAQRIAHIGSWERDIGTNEIVASEEFFRIMDISPDLPAGDIQKHFYARIPEEQLRSLSTVVESAIETCGDFDFEHSLVLDNGGIRQLHVSGYVQAGPDGKAARVFGIVHDISERYRAERQNNLLANILESSLNEIYILNAETFRIEYANKCALRNTGYSEEELKSQRIWHVNPVYDQGRVRRHMAPLLHGVQNSLSLEGLHRRKDGTEYPVDLRIQLLRDHDRELLVAIANDVSERVQRETETREAKVRAERLAYFDPLTKLSNRAGCQRDAKIRFAEGDKPAFLVHVDMDGFKRVNDTLGHLAGDHCLEETGRRLREVCRGLGTAYRWGGDEFVILASSSSSDPNELCERARRLMRVPMEYEGSRFWPTVSMGIALCPEDGGDFDTLLVNADLALYQSKESGKDRITFFKPDMKADSETEARVERELHGAVKNREFVLHFQPQVNMRSHQVTGVEALVRWQHPDRGLVSPGLFLPVVEKTSLAPILGEIVIDNALAAARSWLDRGLDFGRISINLSPSHLASGLLVDHFKSAMERHNVSPERITAEVLESVFLNDNRSGHQAALRELYELGVHIELDDFGTGYASLTHLSDLPINGLKIDQSFTRQMLDDPKKEAVVNHLIHLARALNIDVICEGVETEEQYDRLRMMGDFSIQGYLIARPMTYDMVTDWISETSNDLYYVV